MRKPQDVSESPVPCFQVTPEDNVATLLADAAEHAVLRLVQASSSDLWLALQTIQAGHKVALKAISPGTRIVKFGFPIGVATHDIAKGEWVHLHNCASLYDAGSSELDLISGARGGTPYA